MKETEKRTSSTFFRIDLNLVVRASRFFARSECPVWAPFSLNFVFVNAIRVGKMVSLGPDPDIFAEVSLFVKTERHGIGVGDNESKDQEARCSDDFPCSRSR